MVLAYSEEDAETFPMVSVEDMLKHWSVFMPLCLEEPPDSSLNVGIPLEFMVGTHNAVVQLLLKEIERQISSVLVSVHLCGLDSPWRTAATVFEKPELATKENISQDMISVLVMEES